MRLDDCIRRAVDAGEMDPERAREALDLFADLEKQFRGQLGPGEAARRAGDETVAKVREAYAERAKQRQLQTAAWERVERNLREYRNMRGENDMAYAVANHVSPDQTASFSAMEQRKREVLGRAHAHMDAVFETFRRKLTGGVRNKAMLDNVARERFGQRTADPAAQELAEAWGRAAEYLRERFNAAGGKIAKLESWGLPQSWDSLAVRKVPFEEFRDFIKPELGRSRMIDQRTGQPFTDETLELALRDAYESIITEGMAKVTPSGRGAGRALANRRLDHRFLHFKDGDAWLRVMERFGSADVFSTMIGHMDSMAREIAQMEILGPNPRATWTHMQQFVRKEAAMRDSREGGTRWTSRADRWLSLADDEYELFKGMTNRPVDGTVARSFVGLRNILTSAQLGSASILALASDPMAAAVTARMNRLPVMRTVGRIFGMFSKQSAADRQLAMRAGLTAEGLGAIAASQMRFLGEANGPEITRRISDGVLRASFLTPWTNAGRWAFGMEFMATLAERADLPFDQLPDAMQRTMSRYGLGPGAWDVMRQAQLYNHEGAVFLRPEEIEGLGTGQAREIATRMLEMIQTETDYAIPTASLRGRAAILSTNRPGTFSGELIRSAAMYKSFPMTIMLTHIRRAIIEAGEGRFGYLPAFLIGMSVMGAVGMQFREMAQGRDPRPMDDPRFWMQAMMYGGGFGILGDFLFDDQTRHGHSLGENLAGPVAGFIGDSVRLTVGNAQRAFDPDQETRVSSDLVNMARRYVPGSSIWYARLAYERMLMDQLQMMADPRGRQQLAQRERRQFTSYGNRFWWRPGETRPDRLPDLEAANLN